MRDIKEIIIHCTATREGVQVTPSDVDKWHRQRGFTGIGYHYLIDLDGRIFECRSEEFIGAHCKGHNKYSIGVCYVGGLDSNGKPKDTRTDMQKRALHLICAELRHKFGNIPIRGHYEYANKSCPCFDVNELEEITPISPMTLPKPD